MRACVCAYLRERFAASFHRCEHRVVAVQVNAVQERHTFAVLVEEPVQANLALDQRANRVFAFARGKRYSFNRRGPARGWELWVSVG